MSTSHHGGFVPWIFIWWSVWLAGGRAFRITPKSQRPADELQGLVLSGGSDVAPQLFGEEPVLRYEISKATRRRWLSLLPRFAVSMCIYALRFIFGLKRSPTQDPERDQLESTLMDDAISRGIPVLGICRGMQFINVYFEGSLHQHLGEFYGETAYPHTVLPHKRVVLVEGSRLHDILGATRLKVNALHYQAVKDLGEGIAVSAQDEAGIVQALEHCKLPFVIGVQWHPEFLPQFAVQRKLFHALVREAQRFAS
ncbi:gamma-glutamyl-gamma-aminobutyrate hydrolase family protein [Thermodesulfobacteriota bacterium]